jgi:hypothetical protein
VARSQNTYSALDELRQIQAEARKATSVDALRNYFDRIQAIRHQRPDDFDTQLLVSEVQEEVIARARTLRGDSSLAHPQASFPLKSRQDELPPEEVAEIPGDVPRIEPKTLKWALYLAVLFTAVVLAAFFYLIQTARRINLMPNEASSLQTATSPTPGKQAANSSPAALPPAPTNPTLRLYTDLIPASYTLDDNPPQDLKDGELILDNLQPGQHSIKVTGRSGNAAFTFDVSEKSAPRVIGLPTASNAMAVLVSEQDGTGRLITNAEHSTVFLDGKPAGEVGTDGLELTSLGTTDHDLQVTQDKDRQRFVLTYTQAPVLTVYVKSDPNAGTLVVKTGQDEVNIYIDGNLYKRQTDHGQLRIPLKVGEYTIRVHKAGFIDPPPESIDIKKAEEAAVEFRLDPAPDIATLNVKGGLPGTMIYIDKNFAAVTGADGNATISNVKPGDHVIELRRDQALPKRFERLFHSGEVILLAGVDATLEKVVTESTPAPPPPEPGAAPAATSTSATAPPRLPVGTRHYSFQAQAHVGGLFKHSKLQWYAGYQDSGNFVLFTLDGKHASIHEVRDGKSYEVSKTPFNVDSNQWVQVDLAVKSNVIDARVKTADGEWTDIGSVSSPGRDFTQGKIGVYPGTQEVGPTFSNHQ